MGVGGALSGKGRLDQFQLLPDRMQRGNSGSNSGGDRRNARPGRTCVSSSQDISSGNETTRGSGSAVTGSATSGC